MILEYEFPVPPTVLWEYLTKPEFRTIVLGASKVELRNQAQGRTAVDSVFYCYHGNMESQQLILDWRPFEQFSTDDSNHMMGVTTTITYKLEPTQDGTRLISLFGKPRGAWIRVMLFILLAKFVFVRQVGKSAEQLDQRIQQDLADGAAIVFPPIEVDKDQVASLAAQALTHND